MPTELFNRFITPDIADKFLMVAEESQFPFLRVRFQSDLIPESWEFLGNIYQARKIGDRFAITEKQPFYPQLDTFIAWEQQATPYGIYIRTVRYIREGFLVVEGVTALEAPLGYEDDSSPREELAFVPGDETSTTNVRERSINGVRYWQVSSADATTGIIDFTLPSDFVAGRYDLFTNGFDESNGEATLSLFINGELVYTRAKDTPFDTTYEVKILENVIMMPNFQLEVRMLRDSQDRGSLSSLRLVPA